MRLAFQLACVRRRPHLRTACQRPPLKRNSHDRRAWTVLGIGGFGVPGVEVRPPADAPPDAVGLQVRRIDAVYHKADVLCRPRYRWVSVVVAQGDPAGVCSTAMPVVAGGVSFAGNDLHARRPRCSRRRRAGRIVSSSSGVIAAPARASTLSRRLSRR